MAKKITIMAKDETGNDVQVLPVTVSDQVYCVPESGGAISLTALLNNYADEINENKNAVETAQETANNAGKNASLINSGVLSTAYGGTGAATAAGGFDNLAGKVTVIKVGQGASAANSSCLAVGYAAVASGTGSTVLGYGAKANSRVGSDSSTALGREATADGVNCTALGYKAIADAGGSVAVGERANASSAESTALGGRNVEATAYCSTALGSNAKAQGESSTALGCFASTSESESRYMQLGSTSLSVLRCSVPLTVTSDERDKSDINDISKGLEFINAVRPVQYVANRRAEYLKPDEELSGEDLAKKSKYGLTANCYDKAAHAQALKKGGRKRVGVLAQQVQEALKSVYGTSDYANIVSDNLFDEYSKGGVPEDVESQLMVGYTEFIPFLIQAVQTLSQRVEKLESILNNSDGG